jgi:hypothetical protein
MRRHVLGGAGDRFKRMLFSQFGATFADFVNHS